MLVEIPSHLARRDLCVWIWKTNFSGRDEDGEQIQALTTRNNPIETSHSM